MSKKRLITAISAAIFVTAEIALGYLLQVTHGDTANLFRFAAILLACAFCFLIRENTADYYCIQVGMIFTVMADWYLVMSEPRMQQDGMVCFSIVQLAYAVLLFTGHESRKAAVRHVGARLGLCAVAVCSAFIVLGEGADALSLISMFYYANILMNAVVAFCQIRRSVVFPIALVLFVLCDTCIGLDLMFRQYLGATDVGAVGFIANLGFDISWAFYLPSQMLIPLSLLEKKKTDDSIKEKKYGKIRMESKNTARYA